MSRLLLLSTLALALWLAACAVPPTEAPPSPTVQNTISPTQTPRPTSTITVTLTHIRFPTPTLDPKQVDPGLVYGKPCKAPCWFNMIPGKTTVMEILDLMPRLRTMESPYEFPDTKDGMVPVLINAHQGPPTGWSVYLETDIDMMVLQAIEGSPGHYYSLGPLITQFGEPEAIVDTDPGTKVAGPCKEWTSLDESAPPGSIARILYPRQGLMFTVQVPTTIASSMLCPEMHINYFCYYSPMTLQEAMTNNRLADLCEDNLLERITEKNLVKWHGFGSGY